MGSVSDNRVVIGDASASQLLRSAGHLWWNEGVEEPTAETVVYRDVVAEALSESRRPPAETNNLVANGSDEVPFSSRRSNRLLILDSLLDDDFFSETIWNSYRFFEEELQDPVLNTAEADHGVWRGFKLRGCPSTSPATSATDQKGWTKKSYLENSGKEPRHRHLRRFLAASAAPDQGGTMQDPVLSTSEVALDVVETPPAEGNGSAPDQGGTMQDPVLSTSEVALDVIETPLAEGNGSAEALLASRRSIASVTGVGTDSFRQRMLEEGVVMPDHVPANPVVEPNIGEELPAETNKESLCGILGGGGMKPSYAFTLVVFGAIGLLEVKAQARFPFKTNPQISKVACTSLLLCGLAAMADHVISSTPLGPKSVYARAARWGGYVFAFVMAGSLASLLFI